MFNTHAPLDIEEISAPSLCPYVKHVLILLPSSLIQPRCLVGKPSAFELWERKCLLPSGGSERRFFEPCSSLSECDEESSVKLVLLTTRPHFRTFSDQFRLGIVCEHEGCRSDRCKSRKLWHTNLKTYSYYSTTNTNSTSRSNLLHVDVTRLR